MALITKKDIEELDKTYSSLCVSMFIPTHRSGQEVLQRQDRLLFKNQLKDVKNKLAKEGYSLRDAEKLIAPIQELYDNGEFWRRQSDGLALFLTKGFFKVYKLPVSFETYNQVRNSFYLKPLMPMFVGDGIYFVLTLELNEVKLYELTRHSIAEVHIKDLIPAQMEERVGYDFEQRNLQFRGQHETHRVAVFHGHNEAERDYKNEILRYFAEIDKGLMTLLHDKNYPMVVVSQDYLFSIYKDVNTYKGLLDSHISYNLSIIDKFILHKMTWETMGPIFDNERNKKIEVFKQYDYTDRASSDIKKIVPAALDGKIDTLFICEGEDVWGVYDPMSHIVKLDKNKQPSNVSLMDKVAVATFLNGGKVYILEKDKMPHPSSKVNALYRF